MKGTKDKMEVDGTKLRRVAAVFPQENTRKRAEAQKKKAISLLSGRCPKGQKSGHTRLFCAEHHTQLH